MFTNAPEPIIIPGLEFFNNWWAPPAVFVGALVLGLIIGSVIKWSQLGSLELVVIEWLSLPYQEGFEAGLADRDAEPPARITAARARRAWARGYAYGKKRARWYVVTEIRMRPATSSGTARVIVTPLSDETRSTP